LAVIIFRMKHHLITGAASGFGFALARTLLSRGDTVMACDINTAPMEQLRAFATASDRLQIRQLNVRDPSQWEQTMHNVVQLWPRIDTVMNPIVPITRRKSSVLVIGGPDSEVTPPASPTAVGGRLPSSMTPAT